MDILKTAPILSLAMRGSFFLWKTFIRELNSAPK